MDFEKDKKELEMSTTLKCFIKSLIENLDRGMTIEELRKFLVELLE